MSKREKYAEKFSKGSAVRHKAALDDLETTIQELVEAEDAMTAPVPTEPSITVSHGAAPGVAAPSWAETVSPEPPCRGTGKAQQIVDAIRAAAPTGTLRSLGLEGLVRCPECKSADVISVLVISECCQCGKKWNSQ